MRLRAKPVFTHLLLLSTALAAGPVLAQGTTQLDALVVDGGGTPGGYAQVQTSAGSKLSVAVTKIPQSVSVVTRDQLDQYPNASAAQVLRNTAGVSTETYGTDADTDWFYIRGFQAEQTGVFMDGLPLYQTGFGTFLVDPFLLEQVEVLKGPASVLYGGASVGGIVNFTGKRPRDERFLRTETGINNFGNAYIGVDGGDVLADGDLAYRVTGKLSGGGWETDKARDLRGVIQGSATWSPSDQTELTVYGSYQNVGLVHTSSGFLPYVGTAIDAPGGVRIPRDLYYGEEGFDRYDRQQVMLGYELEHDINGDWSVRQNARYAGVNLIEDYVYSGGVLTGSELNRFAFGHETQVGTVSIDTQLEGHFTTGALDHALLLGFDYKHYGIDERQGFAAVDGLDVLNPVYGAAIPPLFYYRDDVITMNQAGFYVQDQIAFDSLILTLNGRYDHVWTAIDNRMTPVNSASREEGNFSGRVGLAYEFDNGITPYVSYATSFNPSLSTDAAGNLFRSETGEQWEAGIKYDPAFFDSLITASIFNINRNNVVGPDPSNPLVQAAVGQVNVRGAELEALANVSDFTLRGALTYLEAEVLQSAGATPAGNSPVQVPTLTASLGIDYTFADGAFEGLTMGAGMRYLGESWADPANTAKVPDAALFDASLRYEKDDWGVALNINNIFDTSYVSSCQSLTSCGYGAGRTATVSLHKSW